MRAWDAASDRTNRPFPDYTLPSEAGPFFKWAVKDPFKTKVATGPNAFFSLKNVVRHARATHSRSLQRKNSARVRTYPTTSLLDISVGFADTCWAANGAAKPHKNGRRASTVPHSPVDFVFQLGQSSKCPRPRLPAHAAAYC